MKTRTKTNLGYLAFIVACLVLMFGLSACGGSSGTPPDGTARADVDVERPEPVPEPSPKDDPVVSLDGEQPPPPGTQSIDDAYYDEVMAYTKEAAVDWPFGRDNLIELVAAMSDMVMAERAVDDLNLDWDVEAVESADYLINSQDIGSREDLLRGLAEYGYTDSQAEHAATKVGF